MYKYILICIFTINLFSVENVTLSDLQRQKLEVKRLKKELGLFYDKKEKEYKDRKKELESILQQIQKEKASIKKIHDENLALLKDIKENAESKTAKIYNKLKPKIAASIFNEMISEGKIDDVFDIVLRLKEGKITALLRFLDVSNAAKLTQMLKNYKVEK